MNGYRYTQMDLLGEDPYHYFFSPIEGPELLDKYLKDRGERLARLLSPGARQPTKDGAEAALVEALDRWCRDRESPADAPPAVPTLGATVETEPFLTEIARFILAGGDATRPPVSEWTGELLRKFEVAKRLRRTYDVASWRMLAPDSAGLAAYALLGFIAAASARGPFDLQALNVLLKINDLVLSGLDETAPALVSTAAACAVTRETELIRELIRHKTTV